VPDDGPTDATEERQSLSPLRYCERRAFQALLAALGLHDEVRWVPSQAGPDEWSRLHTEEVVRPEPFEL
jgi:hypothetical protein